MASISEYRVPAEIVIPITTTEKGVNADGALEVEVHADVDNARIEIGDGVILGACSPSQS